MGNGEGNGYGNGTVHGNGDGDGDGTVMVMVVMGCRKCDGRGERVGACVGRALVICCKAGSQKKIN
jgi:hypothetical protein